MTAMDGQMELVLGPLYVVEVEDRLTTTLSRRTGGSYASPPQSLDDARRLAATMVRIGRRAGRRVAAVLSSMDQPLGLAIGNALEVREAIATLQGRGPADLAELCVQVGTQLILLAGKASAASEAEEMLRATLTNGAAWAKFHAFVVHQGGSAAAIEHPEQLPEAPYPQPIPASAGGCVHAVDSLDLALVAGELGGGRRRKGDRIDPAVGIVLNKKVGDQVQRGEALATVHAPVAVSFERTRDRVSGAFTIGGSPVEPPPLIYEIVS